MLIPKKLKHRKHHRGHTKGIATTGNYLAFGDFGIRALENGWVTSRQIEASRRHDEIRSARGKNLDTHLPG